jgi:HK97 gp10 family phage protein|nr:MAG TPA: tail component protein [Caudoviricetes sp.]
MTRHEIKFSLSKKSIRQAINALEAYKKELKDKCNLLSQRLAEKGVEIARAEIVDLDAVFTSELLNSIHSEDKGNGVWAVVAGTDHALFVEFGTGQVGQQSPYPYGFPEGISWSYNTGKTIRQALNDIVIHGSTFVKAGEYYWSYVGKDGKIHITKGMPSRPFMYNTANELMDKIVETAREVFGK